jgi:small subunit ribosomal protein S20
MRFAASGAASIPRRLLVAHSASAIKRHRQSLRRRERNPGQVTAARSAVRRAREAIAAGSTEDAREAVRAAASVLDRAARKGILHANNASRRKARIMRQLNTLQQGGKAAEAPKRRRATGTKAKPAVRKSTPRGKKS